MRRCEVNKGEIRAFKYLLEQADETQERNIRQKNACIECGCMVNDRDAIEWGGRLCPECFNTIINERAEEHERDEALYEKHVAND